MEIFFTMSKYLVFKYSFHFIKLFILGFYLFILIEMGFRSKNPLNIEVKSVVIKLKTKALK
jgi:hypothetical protein